MSTSRHCCWHLPQCPPRGAGVPPPGRRRAFRCTGSRSPTHTPPDRSLPRPQPSQATRQAGCESLLPLPSDRRPTAQLAPPGTRRSRGPGWGRSVLPMPEAVVGCAIHTEIPRLGAAAKGKRNDVVELQQEAGPAAPPAVRIDVAAAAAVAAPNLAPHRCRNVPGSTRPVGRLRTTSGRAGCL